MTKYSALCLLLLSACRVNHIEPLTNDEIIAEVKKCESAGLSWVHFSAGVDYKTYRVECRPRIKHETEQ